MKKEEKNIKISDLSLCQDELSLLLGKVRGKLLGAILKPKLDKNLGFSTKTQCYKVLKSALIESNIYSENESSIILSSNNVSNNKSVQIFNEIRSFIEAALQGKPVSFEALYENLSENHTNKELIPVYLAVELRQYMNNVAILKSGAEMPITAQTLEEVHTNPDKFELYIEKWDSSKTEYLYELHNLFCSTNELYTTGFNITNLIHSDMYKWLYSLPKYTLISKTQYTGNGQYVPLDKEFLSFKNSLKAMNNDSMNYLFKRLPEVFGETGANSNAISKLKELKQALETQIDNLKTTLQDDINTLFDCTSNNSLCDSLKSWANKLNDKSKEYAYKDGEEKILQIIHAEKEDTALFQKLSAFVVGLNIDCWSENSPTEFILKLKKIKNTIEHNEMNSPFVYTLQITDENKNIVKKYPKEKHTYQSRLLCNELNSLMKDYGNSINIGEKRQVLLDVLQSL